MTDDVTAELLAEFRRAAHDTIIEWCRRWPDDHGNGYRVRYMDDGTAEIERETDTGFDTVRVHFGVAAVTVEEEPNKPTGFVLPRPWELVPAGWFVRTPDLKWYEVIGTKLEGGKQHVTLKAPDGRTGTFPRDPKAEVKVRRGTQTNRLSDAIESLSDTFGGTSIVKDDPPWDE